ncbi:MAG: SIMPL domain-containing protein [bacterium]
MKSLKSILIAVVFIFTQTLAQEPPQKNQLVITGTAEIIVEADNASVDFSFIGYGETLREAVGKAKDKVTRLSSKLVSLGVKEKDLVTSYFSSGENFDGKAFLSSSKDFVAKIQVGVVIKDLSKVEEIILAISESDVETLSNINFQLEDYTPYKKQAREKAINAAKTKAQEFADGFGVKLGKPILITQETTSSFYPNPFNNIAYAQQRVEYDMVAASPGGFYSKTFTVTESVNIVYAIE